MRQQEHRVVHRPPTSHQASKRDFPAGSEVDETIGLGHGHVAKGGEYRKWNLRRKDEATLVVGFTAMGWKLLRRVRRPRERDITTLLSFREQAHGLRPGHDNR